jgi:hypothetical protein
MIFFFVAWTTDNQPQTAESTFDAFAGLAGESVETPATANPMAMSDAQLRAAIEQTLETMRDETGATYRAALAQVSTIRRQDVDSSERLLQVASQLFAALWRGVPTEHDLMLAVLNLRHLRSIGADDAIVGELDDSIRGALLRIVRLCRSSSNQ